MIRGKVDISITNRDTSDNVTDIADGQVVTPVRNGASISEAKNITDLSPNIKVNNPGSIKDNDVVWVYDLSAEANHSVAFTVNGDPSYNSATDDWTVTFDTPLVTEFTDTTAVGDRLILDYASANRITPYISEVGTTEAGASQQVTADSDGRVQFYCDEPTIDIWLSTSSPVRTIVGVLTLATTDSSERFS